LTIGSLVLSACLFRAARARWADELAIGLTTLGGLVRTISPETVPSGGRRLVFEQGALDQVRRITAAQLGLKLERVRPESRFVDDPGMP
jgi:hypothetical protein